MNNTKYINIGNNQIYNTENNYIFYNTDIDKSKNLIKEKIISKMIDNSKQLNKFFIVKQGTLSGADFTTKYHLENFKLSKDVKINDGIFVLNMENVRDLDILKNLINLKKNTLKIFIKIRISNNIIVQMK